MLGFLPSTPRHFRLHAEVGEAGKKQGRTAQPYRKNMATKDKKKDLTAEERLQYDEWKAQYKDKQLSKSDQAIIQMASNGIVNAITPTAATAFLVLYSTYQRNFHFVDVGEIRIESVQITERTKKAKKVGEFDFYVSKNKCKYIFRLMGCEIEVTYKKDPNFMEV